MPPDVLEIGADEAVGIDTVLEVFVHHPRFRATSPRR
jgi:hypothetical protein